MENVKEDTIHQTAMKLSEEIKNLSIYKSFYSDVQVSDFYNIPNVLCSCYIIITILIYFVTNRNLYLRQMLKKMILSKLYNRR